MDTLSKLLGGRCELVVGATEFTVPTGFVAYAAIVRVDGTIVAAVKERATQLAAASVTGKTWQSVALKAMDYIPFEKPVTSITLTGATDSVFLYLEPKNY